jgi:aspartyl-tRNA(Asn)/glutamyl-tRNA(Gln) amidotransferase subunit A
MVYMAMGSDTGGSIRIPAAFCGTVGLKPTYGRVSRYGTLPLSYTLDHMGPLTRTVRDAALVLNAIAGHDPHDPASSRRPKVDFEPEEGCSIRGLRVGIPQNFYFDRCDPAVEMAVRGALARAGSLGAVVKPVTVPDIDALNAVARVILLAEAAAVVEPRNEPEERFGPDVRALLAQGRLVPATDYVNAQRLRRKMRVEFAKIWTEVDCLCTPAVPHGAQPLGAATIRIGGREEDARIATTRLVRAVNLLGLPALSMPCGQTASGMPVGMQLIAPAFEEQLLLRVGAALEDAGIGIPPPPV